MQTGLGKSLVTRNLSLKAGCCGGTAQATFHKDVNLHASRRVVETLKKITRRRESEGGPAAKRELAWYTSRGNCVQVMKIEGITSVSPLTCLLRVRLQVKTHLSKEGRRTCDKSFERWGLGMLRTMFKDSREQVAR